MRVLLDTHAFLWWISDSPELSDAAREAIADQRNAPIFSAVSGWEIAIKTGLGKLELPGSPARFVNEQLSQNGLEVLPIHSRHALGVYGLPDHHRDPFDRLLVSQAVVEKLPILTADPEIPRYPVETLW
ncbi:MAG: type II toxin-antitoxin system VapC family toxin [Actinomycetota bacterium]|nr:type II toxin-antitoxin system VapC family toxin [Actinomycetota bacterium]MDP9479677.1 type II toxin-antitoxin system VapC family toxin [Actinomycetota bacterium]